MTFKGQNCTVVRIYDETKKHEFDRARMEVQLLNLLTSNVSHEMLTPLGCMTMFAERIVSSNRLERNKEHAKLIVHSSNMLTF